MKYNTYTGDFVCCMEHEEKLSIQWHILRLGRLWLQGLPGGGEFDPHALGVGNLNYTLDFM